MRERGPAPAAGLIGRSARELRRFLVALGYFTRLPIPAWVGWSVEELDRAARYFALVGALVGAVIPRTAKEKELLAPLGKRIGATAAAALAAAKETGRSELDNIGLSKGAAKDQAKTLLSNVAKAAGTAGKAALDAGKEQAKHAQG